MSNGVKHLVTGHSIATAVKKVAKAVTHGILAGTRIAKLGIDMNDNPHGKSRLITWAWNLALLCLLMMPIGVLAVRVGIPFAVGLAVFALSCFAALAVVLAMIAAYLMPRYHQHRTAAIKSALPALLPALLILTVLVSSISYPPIHDITTNTDDPPLFDAAVAYRGAGTNPVDINPDAIAAQLESYTGLASITSPLSEAEAFARASAVAESMEWVIYNNDPRMGVIEASSTSFWFGFVDDIVIRVRGDDTGSIIDLRSVSRVGVSDLGSNAKRIKIFIQRFAE